VPYITKIHQEYVKLTFLDPTVIPMDRDTGFHEPLSKERNTTLPHPVGLKVNAASTEEDLKNPDLEEKCAQRRDKIKGDLEVIEGKILHNSNLVEKGKALKHGVHFKRDT
jgi:hypothetical protein